MNNLQSSARVLKSIFILLTMFIVVNNHAYADCQPKIEIENFWIVQPPDVARSTAGYGTIKNTGSASDTLLKISSDAGFTMLHKTEIVSGIAKMMHMSEKEIAAGSEIVLEPMSYHLMLSGLAEKVYNKGETVTLIFEFEKSGIIKIEAPIRSD